MIGVGCMEITANERAYVNRVLDSGLITAGPILSRFEETFAARHGRTHGLMVNSGTDALRIALATLKEVHGWDDGDEVIVPALTFISTANVVRQVSLVPVFVDVDPKTFLISPKAIAESLSARTRAIIPVHLFGLVCNMNPIQGIAQVYGLKIVEDSCEAMGVSFADKPVGSLGDIGCFSTYAAHIISTGVGGLAVTSDDQYANIMRSFANHGRDPAFLGFSSSRDLAPDLYRDESNLRSTIARRFSFLRVGYSSRTTQFEAALGLAQLERLDEILEARWRNFDLLHTQLKNTPGIALQEIPAACGHAAMMFPIVLTNPALTRIDFMAALETKGIETRPFFDILGQRPYMGGRMPVCPVAENLSRRGFYVGCHQMLDQAAIWHIVEEVKAAADRLVAA